MEKVKKKFSTEDLIKYNEKCSTFRINVETIQRIGTSLTKTKLMKVWYAYLEFLLIGNTEVDFKNDASMILAYETLIAEQNKKMKYFNKKYGKEKVEENRIKPKNEAFGTLNTKLNERVNETQITEIKPKSTIDDMGSNLIQNEQPMKTKEEWIDHFREASKLAVVTN